MALTSNRLSDAVTRRARTKTGKRLGRFAVAAVAALATNEIVLAACLAAGVSAGWAAVAGWLGGVIVSYILSRWAFGRKARPNLLKETLPFWIVSAMVLVILTLATKLGSHAAGWLHLHHIAKIGFIVAVNLAANFLTFVGRFIFFHYVLFADRGSAAAAASAASGTPEEGFVLAEIPAGEMPAGGISVSKSPVSKSAAGEISVEEDSGDWARADEDRADDAAR